MRSRLSALLVGLVLLLVSACSASPSPQAQPPAEGGSDGAFPVSIKHALGTAEIPAAPKRIVALGQGSAETAIALGVIPVGIEAYPWGADQSGQLPWIREAVEKRGGQLPTLIKGSTELDIEAIVAADPDLILANWSGITPEQYKVLSDLAPTIAYPDKAWSTNWDQQIKTIATALGQPTEGDRLIAEIDDTFAKAAASRPNYRDISFVYAYTNGPGTLGIFLPDEQRVAFLTKLGLKLDPVVATLPETSGTDSALLGLENANKVADAELFFTFYSDADTRKQVEAQPLYAAIPAVQKGAVIASNDQSFVTGSSMINPLTVPWAIERYLPLIDAQASKVAG
ncbi:iron complex transport system substrate-binding protein [Propionibacteriaceae bacterium ES.041]|uniref:iron-siderophore ABC transporter substrate-binding protein n=1 Tax=Enemella evansiae TaxID=2016499 RepID=UPI000B95DDDD|nr:iron-siderophore ABC transporter substrate-binding protein [Enemella evansiae]OYN94053.1 iron ABC transporter substrate-binding protein [Enemella evansiae]PFG68657.1 iron complex transport system substrate-binding protein [Propionibacteriaceae bacterium ES.041]